ncbi:MAG: tetratricopeptide repeat protein [Planctomycetota bacterium]|jgi:tetratricopeptide (TPR) repeat protein
MQDKETILGENASQAPSDRESPPGEARERDAKADTSTSSMEAAKGLSEREVFAGDEDFYKSLADSAQDTARQSRGAEAGLSQGLPEPIRHRRFSILQKLLAAGIAMSAAVLIYAIFKSPLGSRPDIPGTSFPQKTLVPGAPTEDLAEGVQKASPQETKEAEPVPVPPRPLSLKIANTFYLEKDYRRAYEVYSRLRESLQGIEQEQMKDFLRVRMALCAMKAGDPDGAGGLFRAVLGSRSPIIRVLANYHLSLLEMQKKLYLRARMRAYQTLALIGAVGLDSNWTSPLQRDCLFLAAESLTRNVLSLCDADKDLPEDMWSEANPSESYLMEPFRNPDESQLRSLLNSGSKQLSEGLLGPRIEKLMSTSGSQDLLMPRWSVICHGASLEELVARFAANAGLALRWASGKAPTSDGTENNIRKRPVSLYMPATTAEEFISVATGCVGLLAQSDGEHTISISNPTNYISLPEHTALLSNEAVSLWQKFMLAFPRDSRIPNAHFAAGLLQAQRGQVADAIAEHKLVANRFSQTSLAPFALLHSSRLKSNLRHYFGARDDLKQLIDQYPDSKLSDRACLYLADATMKAGLHDEAGRLYSKVYNLGYSLKSQTAATLGASRCFYEKKDYEAAAKWLTRYVNLAKDRPSAELYSAYLLLGKSYLALGKPGQAGGAFQYALTGQLAKEEYVETVSALVKAHIQQENFIEALDILENVRSWQLSQKQFTEILLLKASLLRTIGLTNKAIATLGDRAEYASDPQLKARICFELSKCYIAGENLELAHRNLSQTLTFVEPGPLAHEITLELADVCLKLGQSPQTISLCLQLLDSNPPIPTKQKALSLLAAAYNREKDYNKAALALLGCWDEAEATNDEVTSDAWSQEVNQSTDSKKTDNRQNED